MEGSYGETYQYPHLANDAAAAEAAVEAGQPGLKAWSEGVAVEAIMSGREAGLEATGEGYAQGMGPPMAPTVDVLNTEPLEFGVKRPREMNKDKDQDQDQDGVKRPREMEEGNDQGLDNAALSKRVATGGS